MLFRELKKELKKLDNMKFEIMHMRKKNRIRMYKRIHNFEKSLIHTVEQLKHFYKLAA